jgi:hypothetical protein
LDIPEKRGRDLSMGFSALESLGRTLDGVAGFANDSRSVVASSLNSLDDSFSPAGTKKPAISSPVKDMPEDELQPESVLKKIPDSDITTAETGRFPASRKTETLGKDISNTSRDIFPESGTH